MNKKNPPPSLAGKKRTPRPPSTKKHTAPSARKPSARNLSGRRLLEHEERIRAIFDNSTAGVALVDLEGRYLEVNPALCAIFGYSEAELLKKDFFALTYPEDMDLSRASLRQVIAKKGKNVFFQKRYVHKDGHIIWANVSSAAISDGSGKPSYFVTHVLDITEHKKKEQELEKSESRYRRLFETASIGIFRTSPKGKIFAANPAVARMFGYNTPEEMIRSVDDIGRMVYIAPENREAMIRTLADRPEGMVVEHQYRRKDGKLLWGRLTIQRIQEPDGTVFLEGFIQDITEQKTAEEDLRESESQYRRLFESSSIGVFRTNLDGKPVAANPAAAQMLGYDTPEELIESVKDIGRTVNLSPENLETMTRDLAGPQGAVIELQFRRKDGAFFWGRLTLQQKVELDGTVYVEGFIQDFTKQKTAEEALRESEERYRSLFSNSLEGIGVSVGNKIVEANRALLDIFGYDDLAEFTAIPLLDHVAPASRNYILAAQEKARKGERFDKRFIYQILRKDGAVRDVEISLEHIAIGGTVYTQSTFRDVTEQKRADEALRESEAHYRQLFDIFPDSIVILLDGMIVSVNPATLRLIRAKSVTEVIGRPLTDFIHPDYRVMAAERARWAVEEGVTSPVVEEKILCTDGTVIDADVTSAPIQFRGRAAILVITRDITERIRAHEALENERDIARQYLDIAGVMILALDPEGRIGMINRKGCDILGYSEAELLGQDWFTACLPDSRSGEIRSMFGQMVTAKIPTVEFFENEVRTKTGEIRILAFHNTAVRDRSGRITSMLSSGEDITERKLAENQVRSLSRFPSENPHPVLRVNPEGVLQYFNPASRHLVEAWNLKVGDPIPAAVQARVAAIYQNQKTEEFEWSVGDRIYTITVAPIVTEGYVNLYGRDSTARRTAEAELAARVEELRQRNQDLSRLNSLTEKRMQRLTAMRTVDMAISSSFNLELVLGILLEQLTDQLGVDAADILVFNPVLQTFRFAGGRGFLAQPSPNVLLRAGDSLAGRAIQERRILKIARIATETNTQQKTIAQTDEGFQSYVGVPLLAKGRIKGVMEIYQRDPVELGTEEDAFLEMLAGQAAIAIDSSEMFDNLQSSNDELILAYNNTLAGWAAALELRDREIEGHTQRSADLTVKLAKSLGINEAAIIHVYRGALLHDIGKMGIPDSIVLKPGPLSPEEWTVMRKHPQYAYDLLSSIPYLQPAIEIPYCHHEKWDGTGYPRGLKGEQIPLAARIFSLVDVWDALRSNRPYRKAWSQADTLEYIRSQAGKHFDPDVARSFLKFIIAEG